jgi:hypothetical protein
VGLGGKRNTQTRTSARYLKAEGLLWVCGAVLWGRNGTPVYTAGGGEYNSEAI